MRVSDKKSEWKDVSVVAAIMIGALFLIMAVMLVAMVFVV